MDSAKTRKGYLAAVFAFALAALASMFAFVPSAHAADHAVSVVDTMDFFQSKLQLDPKVDTSGFTVTVDGAEASVVAIPSSAPIDNDSVDGFSSFWESYTNATTLRYNRFQDTSAIAVVFGGEAKSTIGGHDWDWEAMETYASDVAKDAVVHVTWPVVGTYDGREVGMKMDISNIQYGLDYRIANRDALGTGDVKYRDNHIRTPLLQISSLPQYGLIYLNINNADYDVKLFYVDEPDAAFNPADVYYTYSSLSTWTNHFGNHQVDGWYTQEQLDNGEGVFIQEMVRPISAVDRVYVIKNSNIGTADDGQYNTITGKHYVYNGAEAPTLSEEGHNSGYYAAWAGEDQKGNAYDDTVGDAGKLFPRNAVTMHYTDTSNVQFNMLSTSNSQWFTIYPQGLTSTVPTEPTKSVNGSGQKDVFAAGAAVKTEADKVLAGNEVVYTIAQKVNTLGSNTIVRYENFAISDTLPAGVTFKDAKLVRAEEYLSGGQVLSNQAVLYDSAAGVDDGAGAISQSGQDVSFVFNKDYLDNRMPLDGETYYLYIKGTVADSAAGSTLSNTASVAINQPGTMWDPEVPGSGTTAVNQTFVSNTVDIDVASKDAVFDEMLLINKNDVFTYAVTNTVPADSTRFTISDALEPVLQIVGEPTLTLAKDGSAVAGANVGKDGTTVTATVQDGTADADKFATAVRGEQVTLTIQAKIRDDATDEDLEPYILAGGIPNTGHFQSNDAPDVETNNTVVIPPAVKKVNGDFHAVLGDVDEEFTYTITNAVPTRMVVGEGANATIEELTKLTFTDTIDPVIDLVGDVQVKVGDEVVKTVTVDPKASTIEFTLEGDELAKVKGKAMTVEFKAVYDPDKAESEIKASYETVKAADDDAKGVSFDGGKDHEGTPNTATLTLQPKNGSAVDITTNTVTVTPPTPDDGTDGGDPNNNPNRDGGGNGDNNNPNGGNNNPNGGNTTPPARPTTPAGGARTLSQTADATSFATLALGVLAVVAFGAGAYSLRRGHTSRKK